ncbi:MAG: 3-dehydroquinate synthase [Alphaproteobacteria bacterium]
MSASATVSVPVPVTVTVELGARSYDIVIGEGLLESAGEHIAKVLERPQTVIVSDQHVAELHLEGLVGALDRAGIGHREIIVPAGESTKDFAHLEDLLERLLAARVERRDTVLAFGGGMVGDLAGFAASILRRGVAVVQIPTTLLAQVDSSVGGKTGINTGHGKNLVGTFHQPRLVLADTGVLATLPRREFNAGYAEVVKYGLIGDAAFFDWLEAEGARLREGDQEALRRAVVSCCQAKARLVAADETEAGKRALLNLGHTFAHALEAAAGFAGALLHGEAVAIGLVLAFELSARLGLCPPQDAARVRRHLAAAGLPTGAAAALGQEGCDAEALLQHMFQDKKVKDGGLTFVLVRGIGRAFVSRQVAVGEVLAVLKRGLAA